MVLNDGSGRQWETAAGVQSVGMKVHYIVIPSPDGSISQGGVGGAARASTRALS